MRTLLFGALAAVGLTLGLPLQDASAAWVTRTTYHWDAACCRYVPCTERIWVPDCERPVDPCSGPVQFRARYRPFPHYDHDHYHADYPPPHHPHGW